MASLSNILPPGNLVTAAGAQTLTNKTITEMLSVISTNTTAVPSTVYVITASCTLTLPASPVAGAWVRVSNMSGTATITAVNTSKTMVMWLGQVHTGNDYGNINSRVELTNSTTVTAYVSASATPAVIGYQVVEFY